MTTEKKTTKPATPKASASKKNQKSTEEVKSNNFVIVNINGSQEKVWTNSIIEVNRLLGEVGTKIKFDQVLLSHEDGVTKVGTPNLAEAFVEMEILDQTKGEKIHTKIYRAKSRYRKHWGQRAHLTRLKTTNIKI